MNHFVTPHPADLEAAPERKGPRLRVLKPGDEASPLPHSIEAEEYVLSCVLKADGREVMAKALAYRLKPSAFYDTRHAVIFAAAEELYRAGDQTDTPFVAERIQQQGKLEQVGSYAFLTQVSKNIPTTANVDFFIRRVRDLCAQREMIHATKDTAEHLAAIKGDADEIAARLEQHQGHVARALDFLRSGEATMEEEAEAGYQRTLAKIAGKPDTTRHLTSGFEDFDQHFGPFDANNEDWLVIVGAFQNTGKSTFLRWVVWHNLEAGKTVQVFLIETGTGIFLERLAATACNVNAGALNRLPADMLTAYRAKLDWVKGLVNKKLFIFQDGVPLETIVARIDDHARRWGAPDLIAIDHIHKLTSNARRWNAREAEMGYIGKKLADVAKRHNRTLLGLAQLNRSARSEGGNRRPQSHDLRDSGELEQAARRILLLHVPDKDCRGAEQTESQSTVELEVIQAKHNNGRMGIRRYWFRRDIGTYQSLSNNEYASSQSTTKAAASGATKSKADFRGGRP
jgi:replicative DNA helicase